MGVFIAAPVNVYAPVAVLNVPVPGPVVLNAARPAVVTVNTWVPIINT